jgi:hypothetical protein
MKLVLSLSLIILLSAFHAQAQRYARANGNWNDAIWAATSDGVAGSAATPTSSDDVYTNGFSVTVDADVSCRNLNIRREVSNSLIISEFSFSTVSVYGQLSGVTSTGSSGPPSVADALTMGEFETIRLEGSGQKIGAWLYVCPLTNVVFNPGAGNTATPQTGFRIAGAGTITIESGTLEIATTSNSRQIRGASDCALQISSGATLNTNSAINGGGSGTTDAPSTLFGTINVNGSLITTNYVNSTNFSLGSSAEFKTSFNDPATQTEGWWYTTNRPTGGTISSSGTISYNASAAQNVYARQYGNLQLEGSGVITKTVAGTGSVNIQGNLNFTNTGITFSSSLPVIFGGTSAQTISGAGTANLNGGLEINKSAGTFSLGQNVTVQSGITVTAGSFDASNRTITLTGNLSNNGTISFGTDATLGTLVIDGVTSVTGSVPSFGNLTINASGSFTGSGTINVAGAISNSGTFNVSGINFNGTSSQNITGTLSLADITISNTVGVTNNGTIGLTGVLTLNGSGVFDADGGGSGSLTLESTDLTQTARIATLPNPNLLSGNVTVERYINAPEDWRYMAIPITNGNVGMWQDDFPVTGNFSDPSSGGNVIDSSAPSIYYFNAATQAWTAVGSGGSTASTSLTNSVGYSAWSYLDAGVAVDATGTIAKGPIAISLGEGDNLVPNPYPSAIDWDLVDLSAANLTTNSVYVRTGSGTYATYLQGSGTGSGHPLGSSWAGELALGQSFWVISDVGGGTITFQEDDKTSSTLFVREAQPSNYLRIKLQKDGISDDVVVHFKEDATTGKDVRFDALKKLNDIALNVSTYNDDPALDYAINGIPLLQCNFTTRIKLGSTNPEGVYSLSFEDLSSINLGYEITFVDKFLNVEKPITEGFTYSFSITSDIASKGAGRFEVKFTSPVVDLQRELPVTSTQQCSNSLVKLEISNSQPGIQYVFKLDDTNLNNAVTGNGGTISTFINKSSLSYGLNNLSLVASSLDGCNAYIFNDAQTIRFDPLHEVTSVSSGEICGEGSVSLLASGAPLDGSYLWYESVDAIEPIATTVEGLYNTPTLTDTRTYFVAVKNYSGCESVIRVPVEAKVSQKPVVEVTVNGNVLTVNQKTGIQWYRNGDPVSGASLAEYEVKESGLYKCLITKGGCTVESETTEFIINSIESSKSEYRAYPNPVVDYLHIEGAFENASVSMYDNRGRTVISEAGGKNGGDLMLDLRSLKKGLYLLNLRKQNKVFQIKVLKK